MCCAQKKLRAAIKKFKHEYPEHYTYSIKTLDGDIIHMLRLGKKAV